LNYEDIGVILHERQWNASIAGAILFSPVWIDLWYNHSRRRRASI